MKMDTKEFYDLKWAMRSGLYSALMGHTVDRTRGEPTVIVKVCSWHSERLPGSTEQANTLAEELGAEVTHGLCVTCQAAMMRKIQHNGFTPDPV